MQPLTPPLHTVQKNSGGGARPQTVTPPMTNSAQSGLVLERDRILCHNEARAQLTPDITISLEKLVESSLPELLPHSQGLHA